MQSDNLGFETNLTDADLSALRGVLAQRFRTALDNWRNILGYAVYMFAR